jgi:hypothetical protein
MVAINQAFDHSKESILKGNNGNLDDTDMILYVHARNNTT